MCSLLVHTCLTVGREAKRDNPLWVFSARGGRQGVGKSCRFASLHSTEKTNNPVEISLILGCGGNSAVFLQKIEAKPAALLVESRSQQKSFLFLLEEKIRRAQNQKCRENFFAGWRVVASGGGLASLIPNKLVLVQYS